MFRFRAAFHFSCIGQLFLGECYLDLGVRDRHKPVHGLRESLKWRLLFRLHRSIIPHGTKRRSNPSMSYQKAKSAFAENRKRFDSLVDAKWKPYLWNLNEGLSALVEALEDDMEEMRAKIDRLEKDSKRQE